MRNGDDVSECVFLIADLAGYTALTEAHGGTEAAKIVTRYVELAEQVGDALLIVGENATTVVETAIRVRDAVEAEPLFLGVRCGVDGPPRCRAHRWVRSGADTRPDHAHRRNKHSRTVS